MSGTNGEEGGEVAILATQEPTAATSQPQPLNRWASKHNDCYCYLDPRCQLAVAYQEAREYWARNPDDTENAPTEIHKAIDEWLVESRFLERLSLPTGDSSFTLPLLSPGRPRRRHTDGEPEEGPERNETTPAAVAPLSPRKIFRGATGMFRSTRRKRSTDSAEALEDSPDASGDSIASSSSKPPRSERPLRSEPVSEVSTAQRTNPLVPPALRQDVHYAESVYEDAVDAGPSELSDAPAACDSPTGHSAPVPKACVIAEAEIEKPLLPLAPSSIADADTEDPGESDPAYAALMPIFYELEALPDNPRLLAIAASHDDAEYTRFWEAFGELSARDILLAVYAIRSGALDVPELEGPGPLSTPVVVILVVWGLSASILCVYLYCCLP